MLLHINRIGIPSGLHSNDEILDNAFDVSICINDQDPKLPAVICVVTMVVCVELFSILYTMQLKLKFSVT